MGSETLWSLTGFLLLMGIWWEWKKAEEPGQVAIDEWWLVWIVAYDALRARFLGRHAARPRAKLPLR